MEVRAHIQRAVVAKWSDDAWYAFYLGYRFGPLESASYNPPLTEHSTNEEIKDAYKVTAAARGGVSWNRPVLVLR